MFTTTILGAAALIAGSHAHMIMNTPTPYGVKDLQTSPLNGEGYNFPCQSGSRTDAFDADGASNPMVVGQNNLLNFTGSAVHGGGSCQLSVTYDYPPPADKTKWKVIHSFIGSCPAQAAGNLESTHTDADGRPTGNYCTSSDGTECIRTFDFKLPTGIKNGNATIAWTWFNKIGNREMYMNCAPISISGGSEDDTVYNSLPEIFVANIPGECTTDGQGGVIGFPDPGNAITYGEAITSGAQGTCPAAGTGDSSSSSNSSTTSYSASSAVSTAAASSVSSSSLVYSVPQASATSVTSSAASATSSAAPSASSTGSVSGSNSTSSSSTTPNSTSTNGTSSASCASGYMACSSPGSTICSSDGTQFGSCDTDNCALLRDVSAGTRCVDGYMAFASPVKRSIRAHRHAAHGHKMFN